MTQAIKTKHRLNDELYVYQDDRFFKVKVNKISAEPMNGKVLITYNCTDLNDTDNQITLYEEIKHLRPGTDDDSLMTSYTRIDLDERISEHDIADILGFGPQRIGSISGKVNFEWTILYGTNSVITIYDYKGHRWHVGSKNIDRKTLKTILTELFGKEHVNEWHPQ